MNVKRGLRSRIKAYRNPLYLAYAIAAVAIFFLSMLVAKAGVGPIELSIFHLFNSLPETLYPFFWVASLFGSIGMVLVVALIAFIRRHYANMFKILIGGIGAYTAAYALKSLDIRARPIEVVNDAIVREPSVSGHGFPSGHAAVATVLALLAYQYLPKRWHRPVTVLAGLVFISRMYLGVHLPMDLVGGFAIGLFFGGVINFAIGTNHYNPVPPEKVMNRLKLLGYQIRSVKFLSADARGSTPYIATGKDRNYFVKVVGLENTVADWLFKLTRRAVYRRLEDEQPFMSPKRQLEHEAYVAMLAGQAGVQTPPIVAVFEAAEGRWGMAQEMIPGKSLDSVDPKLLTDKVLRGVWLEVKKLHDNKIIHRDLRAANVFLDSNSSPWIIDFGFSEASSGKRNYYRDTVELVASMSLLVGPKRAVAAAVKTVGKSELRDSLPYLSFSSLSGATTKAMKQDKSLLPALMEELKSATGVSKVNTVKMKKINFKTLLIIVSLGIAINVLAPQLASFGDSLEATKNANTYYIAVGVILSALSYLLAGLSYKFLSIHPVKYWPTVLIQVASSFASKLAPAGTGGAATNGRYLYKNSHDPVQAGAVVGTNTILGLVAHLSLVLIVTLATEGSILDLLPDIHIPRFVIIVGVLGAISAAISIRFFPLARKVFAESRDKVVEQLSFYKSNSLKLFLGYCVSLGITLTYASILYLCTLSMGLDLSALDIVYVFTVGSIVATVTPTPGGLGGAEAAYIASLTSLGVDNGTAVAVTLLYRLLTFWLPILPGFIAFRFASTKDYI